MALIRAGRIASEMDLRRAFWQLARKCHPDSGATLASEKVFIQVRDEYEEALALLRTRTVDRSDERVPSGHSPGYSRDECVEAFGDLVASSFPIDPGLNPVPAGYALAREKFLDLFSRRDPGAGELFLQFERDLYQIRGDNVVMNPLFGKIKLILYNIPAAYFGGSFSRRAVTRWIGDLQHGEPVAGAGADASRKPDAGWESPVRIGKEHYPSVIRFVETLAF